MSAHRVSLGLVAALGLACGRPNPWFELAIDTVGASATGDVTGSSSGLPTSGTTDGASGSDSRTGSSGSGGSGSGTSGDASSSSGDATLTGVASTTTATSGTTGECVDPIEPGLACGPEDCCAGCSACLDGVCIPDSKACGACGTCDGDGLCLTMPEGTPCKANTDPCKGKIWGLQGGDCHEAVSPGGTCDLAGDCVVKPMCEPGPPIVECDLSCVVDAGQCDPGAPVAEFDGTKMCAQSGPTQACTDECLFEMNGDTAVKKECKSGACMSIGEQPCGNYACEEASCNMACEGQADCKEPHGCSNNQCV